MSVWNELRRRKVIRVAIGYGIGGWALLQLTSVLISFLNLPGWIGRMIVLFAILGFPVAMTFAWYNSVAGNHEYAIELAERAVKIDPMNAAAHAELGQIRIAAMAIENDDILGSGFKSLAQIAANTLADPELDRPEFLEIRKHLIFRD